MCSKHKFYYRKFYKEWESLYNNGIGIAKISRVYKCDYSTVRQHLIKVGIFNSEKISPLERFNSFVVKKEGCWEWSGPTRKFGYGQITINGEAWPAHRYSYFIYKGDPSGLVVRHTCDNPPCTNPDHLILGTVLDNILDCRNRNRSYQYTLTIDSVKEIKELIKNGSDFRVLRQLAKAYKVPYRTIYRIKSGVSWRDI